jgi:uncharacterized secreted protein with C-terminal beta-propeller domain
MNILKLVLNSGVVFLLTIIFVTSSSLAMKQIEVSEIFPDIGGREDTKSIEYLKNTGIVKGYEDGTYKPDKEISRAEFLKIMISLEPLKYSCSEKEVNNLISKFSDIKKNDWFINIVCDAEKRGIIKGYDDSTFRPHSTINFAESAKLITLFSNLDFSAKNDNQWFEKYIDALESHKVVNSKIVNKANSPLTRGGMSDLIWRLKTGNEFYENITPKDIISCKNLDDQILKQQLRINANNFNYRNLEGEVLDTDFGSISESSSTKMRAIATPLSNATISNNDFTTTNIQENGVDESDIVKNNSTHIYFVRNNTLRIIKAGDEMLEESSLDLEDMNIRKIMLNDDKLILLGSLKTNNIPEYDYYGHTEDVAIKIYDISDPKFPLLLKSFSFDGYMVSSRRVGDILYIISNKNIWNGNYKNFELRVNSSVNKVFNNCSDITYIPNFDRSEITTITSINIASKEDNLNMKHILGAGDLVYSSINNLYITSPFSKQTSYKNLKNGMINWQWSNYSRIFKFSLNKEDVNFVGQGVVKGGLLNKYSLSEHNNNLRLATTVNSSQGRENNISILDENLNLLSSITGIAKGEHIKSVRFMGDKGFVVTFKAVDPLFVIDMNPDNPKVLGELKIPGWSDYLHPIDDKYLIGIGKEVDPENEKNDRLTFDMLKGMKLSIFDVSDYSSPKEIHKMVIGERGTHSEVLNNPLSLFFDKEKKLIGFPISIYESETIESCENKGVCEKNLEGYESNCKCTTLESGLTFCPSCLPAPNCDNLCNKKIIYSNVFNGGIIYSFDIEKGFELQNKFSHEKYNIYNLVKKNYRDYNFNIQRIIRIKDVFYGLSNKLITGYNIFTKEESSLPFVELGKCELITAESSCMQREDCEALWVKPYCNSDTLCTEKMVFKTCVKK